MKTKKYTLDFEDTEDFEVLAVCSHYPDYRLVWTVNKFAGLELQRVEQKYACYSRKGELLAEHVQFRYFDENSDTEYVLLKNKEQRNFLVPELELVDYLLFISTSHQYPTEEIRNILNGCEDIVAVYKVDSTRIKSLAKLDVYG